jgi:hypothetical protein
MTTIEAHCVRCRRPIALAIDAGLRRCGSPAGAIRDVRRACIAKARPQPQPQANVYPPGQCADPGLPFPAPTTENLFMDAQFPKIKRGLKQHRYLLLMIRDAHRQIERLLQHVEEIEAAMES